MFAKFCSVAFAVPIIFAIISFIYYGYFYVAPPIPKLNAQAYWGPRSEAATHQQQDEQIYAFKVQTNEVKIADLKQQLSRNLTFSRPLDDCASYAYGFNGTELTEIVRYWRDDYLPRWQQRVDYLNTLRQYKTEIQGLNVHFIHEPTPAPAPGTAVLRRLPVLLLHGWASSVREFYELIPLLLTFKSNDYAFTVVAPSLNGFAWSDATFSRKFNLAQRATIMRNLMLRLGYTRFYIQSDDWGSIIGDHLATLYPENVLGYHTSGCSVNTLYARAKGLLVSYFPRWFLTQPNAQYGYHFPLMEKLRFFVREGGYFHLQATKPDTIGNALEHNPVGLAAYILEKYHYASGALTSGAGFNATAALFNMDALLDNIMIYYLTDTVLTSMRIYAEFFEADYLALRLQHVPTSVPLGCARFKHDLPTACDFQLRDKYPNIVQSTYYPESGHFNALAVPKILYADFINFVQSVEETYSKTFSKSKIKQNQ